MAVLASPRKAGKSWLAGWKKSETWLFYLCISPWLIGFLIWTAGPMFYSLYLSFTSWDLFTTPQWVGLGNYKDIFTDNPDFWQSMKVTAIYTFASVPLSLVGALAIALLLNSKVRGIAFFRTIFYLPSVLPAIAVAVLWIWVFNPLYGILNVLLGLVGIKGPSWLGDPNWALPALIFMSLWSLGGSMIIYLAGLQGISTTLYEAAELDGANKVQQLFKITIPQLTPTIFFNLVLSIIGSFQVFTQAYAMTQGGPRQSTLFYMYYLFDMAFIKFRMGYASALAWILFAIILVFTLLIIKSSSLWVYYESETK
ncbi:MAG TPA: sugar ABC transporter permease [Chloroflexia bacterium]|nr:sugar ABC transporter permease [Chloroflexia bacterium]